MIYLLKNWQSRFYDLQDKKKSKTNNINACSCLNQSKQSYLIVFQTATDDSQEQKKTEADGTEEPPAEKVEGDQKPETTGTNE